MTEKSKKKAAKKKFEFPLGHKKVTEEEANAEVKKFMDAMHEKLKDAPEAEVQRGAQKMKDFIDGKVSWAELFNFSPDMLFQMAEFGFSHFKASRYSDAERVFKVLTVLDWNNAYYHSVMGSILQRQKRYGEAIAEYTQAIEIDPKDMVSLTNRGEIFMQHGLVDEARADFEKATALDASGEDKFANRAKMLMHELERKTKEKGKGKKGSGLS